MNHSLSSTNKIKTHCELIEADYRCWVLRANQEDETVQKHFSSLNFSLPTPTQVINTVEDNVELTGLGIGIDESWWLTAEDESPISQLKSLVKTYNDENHSTLALINQSAAYKRYQLTGENQAATQLLTHLIPYDWFALQSNLEALSQKTPPQGKVISTIMQSVPIVVYSSFPHQYALLIRRSFADYASKLIQHTANLIEVS